MPPDPSDDARQWLAALAARVEDDEAFLASIPDKEVRRLVTAEDIQVSGVAAAIRRRGLQAERDPLPSAAGARPRWRWAAGGVAVGLLALALWASWPAAPSTPDVVLRYRTELAALAAPPTKGLIAPPLGRGARDLLAAAQSIPPDPALAAEAAAALAQAAVTETDPSRRAAAAYFAALAYQFGGDEATAQHWLRQVPPDSPYAQAAAQALAGDGP